MEDAMTEPARVELTVLGEKLSIRTSASADYLRGLGALVEERAQALGAGTRSLTSVLLLTALDLADELSRTRDEQSRQDGDVDARLRALVSDLQRVCLPAAGTSEPLTPSGHPST
jgi:cell division protein ZapA (FtsZ GTPase activity inhibitor)